MQEREREMGRAGQGAGSPVSCNRRNTPRPLARPPAEWAGSGRWAGPSPQHEVDAESVYGREGYGLFDSFAAASGGDLEEETFKLVVGAPPVGEIEEFTGRTGLQTSDPRQRAIFVLTCVLLCTTPSIATASLALASLCALAVVVTRPRRVA